MIPFFSYTFQTTDLILIALVALLVGMSKTGVQGTSMIVVPLLASVFGGRQSSGVMLPILIFADVMGVAYYHQHASWKHLKILFPWAAMGVIAGAILGTYMDDHAFKIVMASVIVASVLIMLWLQQGNKEKVPDYFWFAALIGIAGGFTSMVGNLAGSIMAVYLLAMRLPKNVYIGTTAWFFMINNLFKVPFHIFVWGTISLNSFMLGLTSLPIIGLGALLGILIVKKIPETIYRWFIVVTTFIAAAFMFF